MGKSLRGLRALKQSQAMEQVHGAKGRSECAPLVEKQSRGSRWLSPPGDRGGRRGLHVELEAEAKPDRVKF